MERLRLTWRIFRPWWRTALTFVLGTTALIFLTSGGKPSAAPIKPPACVVTVSADATEATAVVDQGCEGPGFAFRSFVGIRTTTQFDEVTSPPWVVKLPPCAWQVDFSYMPGTPQHHWIAGLTGSGPCPPTTTTTLPPEAPTTTTVPPPPPTTIPPSQASPGPSQAPLASVPQEQAQVQVSPGVTNGRG